MYNATEKQLVFIQVRLASLSMQRSKQLVTTSKKMKTEGHSPSEHSTHHGLGCSLEDVANEGLGLVLTTDKSNKPWFLLTLKEDGEERER